MEKQKAKFVEDLEKNKKKLSKEFIGFIHTEIELGTNNQFLNWDEVIN